MCIFFFCVQLKKSCTFAIVQSGSRPINRKELINPFEGGAATPNSYGFFYCKKMEELNENLSSLFNESIWLNDVLQAEKSFDELMDLVEQQKEKPQEYDYYDDFGKNSEIEIIEVKEFADAIWVNLISGEWKWSKTPKALWIEAYNSTSN